MNKIIIDIVHSELMKNEDHMSLAEIITEMAGSVDNAVDNFGNINIDNPPIFWRGELVKHLELPKDNSRMYITLDNMVSSIDPGDPWISFPIAFRMSDCD
jgi:hypothetical protein